MYGRALGDALATAMILLVVVAFALGGLMVWGIPKLWEFLKPFIHNLTE